MICVNLCYQSEVLAAMLVGRKAWILRCVVLVIDAYTIELISVAALKGEPNPIPYSGSAHILKEVSCA